MLIGIFQNITILQNITTPTIVDVVVIIINICYFRLAVYLSRPPSLSIPICLEVKSHLRV